MPLVLLLLVLQSTAVARSIDGVVVDPSGAPVAGATVRVLTGGESSIETVTGADGAFVLQPVSSALTAISVSAEGFAETIVRIGRAGAQRVRVVVQPRGIVEHVDVSANPDRLRVTTPASATMLDTDALASAPAWTLDDQLRAIPGFSLFRRSSSRVANPTTQGVTLRGLAASGASRTAVFADGAPLNDPFGGWVYWNRIPAASIDRIEVARGGSSDLHGSDALGGAIRITTSTNTAARIWADAGSNESARFSGYAGGARAAWDLFGAGELGTTDGFVIVAPESRGPIDVPASSEYASAFAGAGRSFAENARFDLRGSYFTEDRGNGTPFQTNATIIRQLSGNAAGLLLGGAWSLRAIAASQDYDQSFSAVAADRGSERPTSVQHVDTSSRGMALEWLRGGLRHGLLVSAAVRQVDAELLEGAAAAGAQRTMTAATQRTGAATIQVSMQPRDRVSLAAGARGEFWQSRLRDSDDGRGTLATLLPRASLAVRVTDTVSVRAAVHRAYRTPTVNELYRPFRVGNIVTRANASLNPEEAFGVEGAVLLRKGRTGARAVAFWTRLSDAVVNVTLESAPSGIVRQRQNAGRIRAAGLELEGDIRLRPSLSITGSVAYIDSIFTAGTGLAGLRVPQVPRWQASAGAHGVWRRAVLTLDWRFIGAQFDDDRNVFALDESSSINARAGWRLRPSLELFAAVENAFDQEQDVGRTPLRTVGLPRTARVGVRWRR
jgi:outer membrane receptor protein involved in Fe transport